MSELRRARVLAVVPDRPDADPPTVPLTRFQRRLWFQDRLRPGNPAYHVRSAVRLSGPLDVQVMARVLVTIERRHEALRIRIPTRSGDPVQVIDAHQQSCLRVVEIEESELAEHIEAEVRSPFDLAKGPLWRATLFAITPADHVLALTMHHIIADGWSMTVLDREIAVLYEAWSADPGADPAALLPALPTSYRQVVLSAPDRLAGEGYRGQLDYWREQLAGAPARPALPPTRSVPTDAPTSYTGARYRFALEPDLAGRLRALGRARNATMFMILITGLAILLAGYTGLRDIVVGAAIANRPGRDLKSMVGFFTNTLAIRVDLRDDPNAAELLARVRDTCLRAYENQDIPFDQVVSELHLTGTPHRNSLFQVTLGLHRQVGSQNVAGLQVSRYDLDSCDAQFALALDFAETRSELTGVWEYSVDHFERADVVAWHDELISLLYSMTAEHQARVETLCAALARKASQRLESRSAQTREANREKLQLRRRRAEARAGGSIFL
jgi:Condensation domain